MPRLSPLRIFGAFPGGKGEPAESGSNARVPFVEISGMDPSTPCGSRGNNNNNNNNNKPEPAAVNPLGEKEKNVASDSAADRRLVAAAAPAKLKSLWTQQHDARSEAGDVQIEQNTPLRRHHSVQKHGGGGGSQFSTPRASKIENKYLAMHSEPGSNSAAAAGTGTGTAKKSVSRTLRYNQDLAARAAAGGAAAGSTTSVIKSLAFCQGKHGESTAAPPQFELEEDLSFWEDHNVQVLIRIRPPAPLEGHSRCLRQDSAHSLTWTGHPESRFTFDHVACESIDQEKLFRVAGLPMVESCISGYNNCMFAYGQTGSGKTHTMLGDIDPERCEGRGMIPRVFEYLFVKIQQEEEARRCQSLGFACKCSFLEIYNEQISDLLEPSSTNLQLREDVRKGVYVDNLREVEVHGVEDVMRLLTQGSANRKVAATNMNRESSRSHSVFTCVVESKWESDDAVINTRFGRLNLVDLAGSERQKSSGAEGDRLKEAANINKSLSTLGLVIMVLVDAANGKPRHVPYRDSKLTFLLQDSLGGNSKTMIIATVSPSSSCSLETLSTLKFAQRAKFIRNNAIVNEDTYGDILSLRQQIVQLKEEVNYLRNHDYRKPEQNEQPDEASHGLGPEVLAASLRREAAAESVVKNLGVEISHLKRLVRQREEDTQQVKMVLRLRENKIRRLEALANESVSPDALAFEDRQALLEEINILTRRVEHNPEVTRFAMENIRLVEELKRYQAFYDHGEREAMSTELSNLRDQLMDILDANALLKEECGDRSHSRLLLELEELRSQSRLVSETKRNYQCLEKKVEELVRENAEVRGKLADLVNENETSRQDLRLEKEKVERMEVEQEAQKATVAGLTCFLQQCEGSNSDLHSQLNEARGNIEGLESQLQAANELQEQMESQQLILISDLESALLKQEASEDAAALKSQLQSLQLELQRKGDIRCMEKSARSLDEMEKARMQQEVLRVREEYEEARELNRLFYRERVRRLSIEKQMDVRRDEVEAETAETIANMHDELLVANEKFAAASEQERNAADEINMLRLENSRLATYCDELRTEARTQSQELHKVWQQAASRIVSYLSDGDDALDAAATEMEVILGDFPTDSSSCKLAKKQVLIEALQSKLHQAFAVVKEAECKMRAFSDTASTMSVLQQRQKEEIVSAELVAAEAACRAETLEARLLCAEENLRSSQKTASVAFIVINNLADALVRGDTERKGDGEVVRMLKSRLRLLEERGLAAFLVVRHCAGVGEELRTGLDEANSVISEQRNAILALQQDSLSESGAKAELQVVREELLDCKMNHSSLLRRLEEAEKLWCIEKERLLSDAKASSCLAGQWTSSCAMVIGRLDTVQEDAEDLKLLVDEALRSSHRESSAMLHAFKSDILELRDMASKQRADVCGSRARVQELLRRLEVAEAGRATAESTSTTLEEELVSSKLALEKALDAHASDKLEFQRLQASVDAERLRFQMALADAQEKLSSSQLKAGELMLDLRRAQEKREAAEQDCMAAVADISDLDRKVQKLDDHMALLEEKNGAQREEIETLTLTIHDLEALQVELQRRNNALLEEMDRKDGAYKLLESTVQNLVEDGRRKQDDAHSKADTILRLQAVIRDVHGELARSNEELAETGKELQLLRDSAGTATTTWQSSIRVLEARVVDLERLLDEKGCAIREYKMAAEERDGVIQDLEQQLVVLGESAKASEEVHASRVMEEMGKKEAVIKGLELDMRVLQESLADVTEERSRALETSAEELSRREEQLLETSDRLRVAEEETRALRDSNTTAARDYGVLSDQLHQLMAEKDNIQNELDEKSHLVESLDLELLELSSLVEHKVAESVRSVTQELNDVLQERDKLNADLLVLGEQLEMAQSLADEREVVAAEARKVAETSKAHVEEKDEEIKVLERSVGELESIVNALENQVGIIKREAQMQRMMREDLETEVQSLRHEITRRNGTIVATNADEETVLKLKEDAARLSEDCFEKEAQVQSYKKHISDLVSASTRQATHYQQRINELEACLEQAKAAKSKGSSSPFKCIGKGLTHQMNSEIDEELSAARQRIDELEAIAAGRQREVFLLNARLAEAESMTHDVVRDLLGVKMDITNYASMLGQGHRSDRSGYEETDRLRRQLEACAQERESCLEEIDHRQGEILAIRVAAENLKLREQTLTADNEKLKVEINSLKRHRSDLENEVRKLSGQQNLQQRIHHHARIKEESNLLRLKNEELAAKLRSAEGKVNRLTEELTRRCNTSGNLMLARQ